MPDFYMTFGASHVFANFWVRIVAPDEDTARRAAAENFPQKWSSVYSEGRFTRAMFLRGDLAAFEVDVDLNHRSIEQKARA